MDTHYIRPVGRRYSFLDLDFWAEDGVIFIEDKRDGDFNAVTCKDFVQRAKALNEEAKRSLLPSDVQALQDCVLMMYECWKEAKSQGDPSDVEIAKRKYRERKRTAIVTGMW